LGRREHDRDRCRRGLGCKRPDRVARCSEDGHLAAKEVSHQSRDRVVSASRPAVLDRDVLALDVPHLAQALPERPQAVGVGFWIPGEDQSDHRHPRLLRPRRDRPRCRRTAEQRDERTAVHSITSPARASSLSGMVRPNAFAVLRLMTNSNLVDSITGKSTGLAPFSIRPTYLPTWRYASGWLGP